jgi:DNA-binding MarR family transcriptional regulator
VEGGLPTRRDLERLAAWSELHRADGLLRAELSRRLEALTQTSLLEHEAVHRLVIAPGRRLTMYQLADALLVSRSGATRLIDRLEGRGWVARRIAPHDRRVVRAELTREGAAAFAQMGAVFAAAFAERFGGLLDDADVAALRRVLAKLLAASPGPLSGA